MSTYTHLLTNLLVFITRMRRHSGCIFIIIIVICLLRPPAVEVLLRIVLHVLKVVMYEEWRGTYYI